MTTTQNLNLPQWQATDRILRTDFNDAMETLDTAVAAKGNCRIETGSYTGGGTYGENKPMILTFDFVPKLVVLQKIDSINYYMLLVNEAAHAGFTNATSSGDSTVTWEGTSVSWYADSATLQFNENRGNYRYVAFGIAEA